MNYNSYRDPSDIAYNRELTDGTLRRLAGSDVLHVIYIDGSRVYESKNFIEYIKKARELKRDQRESPGPTKLIYTETVKFNTQKGNRRHPASIQFRNLAAA